MKRLLFATLILILIGATSCTNKRSDNETVSDEATLLVTFGSSYDAPLETYAKIEKAFAQAYPNQKISWTYTSGIIRKILAKRGTKIDAPKEALEKLADSGYKKINVQSLHIIPGSEYDEMISFIEEFKASHNDITIKVGTPLLYSDEDMHKVAEVLHNNFKKTIDKGEAIVFVGHGTEHDSNDRYARLNKIMKDYNPLLIIGTVEGTLGIDDVIAELKKMGMTNLTMTPLMSIAGDHATNDIASDEEDSWNSLLTKAGFNVTIDTLANGNISSLGDIEGISDIWIKHMEKATEY